jgi:hypothetical protein
MLCSSRNAESRLAPLEPEALVARFSKERTSLDTSRGWGTFFLALAAAHHDPGYNTDASKVYRTVENRTAATRSQSHEASEMIRDMDRALIRRWVVTPGLRASGLVLFPFSKADSYKFRARIAGEPHEFLFQLRTY